MSRRRGLALAAQDPLEGAAACTPQPWAHRPAAAPCAAGGALFLLLWAIVRGPLRSIYQKRTVRLPGTLAEGQGWGWGRAAPRGRLRRDPPPYSPAPPARPSAPAANQRPAGAAAAAAPARPVAPLPGLPVPRVLGQRCRADADGGAGCPGGCCDTPSLPCFAKRGAAAAAPACRRPGAPHRAHTSGAGAAQAMARRRRLQGPCKLLSGLMSADAGAVYGDGCADLPACHRTLLCCT